MFEYILKVPEDLEYLNSFVGYGKFKGGDILFIGIEEGAGRNDIELGARARLENFGKNDDGNFISENLIDGQDYRNGFYEESGLSGANKTIKCALKNGYKLPEKPMIKIGDSPTLYIQARICLYLENNYDAVWFDEIPKLNDEQKYKIENYRLIDSNKQDGITLALFDWKPLLKNDTDKTISSIPAFQKVNEELYNMAFKSFKGDEEYINLAKKRLEIIKNIINHGSFKAVVLMGNEIRQFASRLCPNVLKQIKVDTSSKNIIFPPIAEFDNGTKLIWTYHPSYNPAIGRYNYFKQITDKCLIPLFK